MKHLRWFPTAALYLLWLGLVPCVLAQQNGAPGDALTDTLRTLTNTVTLRDELRADINATKKAIAEAQSELERADLNKRLEKQEADLQTVRRNFEAIATGVDAGKLRSTSAEEFDFQKELFALLRPAIDEMKEMTAHVRQKADLREKIAYYNERMPTIEQAIANLERLAAQTEDAVLSTAIAGVLGDWKRQYAFMNSELQTAQLQLAKLVESETSIAEASQGYLKSFFQKRGLYLTEALLAVFVVLLASRYSYRALRRYLPGFRAKHRSFRIRLIELIHRTLTFLLVIVGPMVVFYVVEDWVLFSVGLLLLIGAALALRQTIPRYWQQMQIFLNVGAVREGERLYLDGIPWVVEEINIFSTLYNPVADIQQRLHLQNLVSLKSRPVKPDDPWFPCRKGDWVILKDGVRGKVVGISPEMVQLVERGGAKMTYLTSDFLAESPRNLSPSFRIKEAIGISYALQKEATGSVVSRLQEYVQARLKDEGYADQLVNLRVEFCRAGESSLELVVIADFKAELADLFNRLRRAIQRYCVDACSEFGWEIPFPQMTLHGTVQRG
ncbi:MAG: hypothetical protein H6955_05110 [Chromatiaceae bacterium]|nr:hypothetical protein [Chromatiaceae bacterium]